MNKNIQAVLLDMDGVLYHGERLIPEAVDFMHAMAHIPHAFITNNPINTPFEIADRLQRIGFVRPQESQIVTSAEATAIWLSQQKDNFRYYAVGGAGLHLALGEVGTACRDFADFVVIGEGEGIDFDAITIGINLIIKKGARLVCTNPDHSVDAYFEGEHRVVAGGGALVAPFAVAAEVEPVFIGKPHPLLFEMALKRLGVAAEHCLMIGDRPDTDIAGAVALGIRTAMVRTGRFSPRAAWPENLPQPDWDVENLNQLLEILRETSLLSNNH